MNKNLQDLLDIEIKKLLKPNVPKQGFDIVKRDIIKNAETEYRILKRDEQSILKDRLNGFNERHYLLWKRAIDPLEAFIVYACEIGVNVDTNFRNIMCNNNYLFRILIQLHAQTVQIGFAVLCLLRNGFADDAHARCRTAHEYVVISMFLKKYGQSSAKRYIDHVAIKNHKAMLQYQTHAETLGQKKFTNKEFSKSENVYNRLIEQYGKSFKSDYGWAAKDLNPENEKFKPDFSQITQDVGFNYFRPVYKMESNNVHAGINFRLGLCDRSNMLLAGPSNYGLADPGNDMAEALFYITYQLLSFITCVESVVLINILAYYLYEISEAFLDVDKNMLNEK